MKKIALIILFASGYSFAGNIKDLTVSEVSNLNWLIQCPEQLKEMSDNDEWIKSGYIEQSNEKTTISYSLVRRIGFMNSELVGWLEISRVNKRHVPAGASAYTVVCEIRRSK